MEYVLTPPKRSEGFTLTPPDKDAGYSAAGNAAEAVTDSLKDLGMGALKGASNIGATILRPYDYLKDKITGEKSDRRATIGEFFRSNANPESPAFKAGELGSEIAGTAGVGGAIARVFDLAKFAPRLATAIETGGFRLGGAPAVTAAEKAGEMGIRTAGGAVTGGASAGLVNPENADAGAVIGGAAPGVVKAAGTAGAALRPKVAEEVRALYEKARALGISIPADRIANSRVVNAAASSLNYIPLSGRAATEEAMVSQFNRAVSKSFGQDTPNITKALREADVSLGDKFDLTLNKNKVVADQGLLDDLSRVVDTANRELGEQEARIIKNQVDELLGKVDASGSIDGRAAYNIKKTLDRLGNRTTNEAFYAIDMKKALMAALNRSLGPQEAAAFEKVRQQYGNMLEVEKIARNGAEGGVSIARIANLKNINNPQLQDLADIAAQFIVGRESPHGAAQRVVLGGIAAGAGVGAPATLPVIAGTIAGGRAANTALNSNTVKDWLLQGRGAIPALPDGSATLRALLYGAANQGSP